jgi:hypothetical protein
MVRPRTWSWCASTRRPTGRSRRSRSAAIRSMSRQPGRGLGIGRRPRHGATDRRALARPPDLLGCSTQTARTSWCGGRQELRGLRAPREARSPSPDPGLQAEPPATCCPEHAGLATRRPCPTQTISRCACRGAGGGHGRRARPPCGAIRRPGTGRRSSPCGGGGGSPRRQRRTGPWSRRRRRR